MDSNYSWLPGVPMYMPSYFDSTSEIRKLEREVDRLNARIVKLENDIILLKRRSQ